MFTKILITVLTLAVLNGILSTVLVIAERFFTNYGECNIIINDERELRVRGGETLLATLNREKIFLPSACGGRGTCAYCKCKITEGVGSLLPTEEPLLSRDEIENQIRLACQIKVKQDLWIEIPEELFNIQEFEAEVVFIKDLTYDIKLIRLNLVSPEEIHFKSGQYIQLQNRPYDKVKESATRAYSIASSNSETRFIDLIIRLVPEGICTTWVFYYLKERERVKLTGPMGNFCLHDGTSKVIMVAGGSGMAPMVSILSEIARKNIERKVIYFFGAVAKKDLFFIEKMEQFRKEIPDFTFVPVLSQPEPEDQWYGETDLITVPLGNYLKEFDTSETQIYLCGSPGMIQACIKVANTYGIGSDRIFYDPFA